MKKDCVGITGWLFGHNFEAVYDTTGKIEVPSTLTSISATSLDVFRNETSEYVISVCKRCGKNNK